MERAQIELVEASWTALRPRTGPLAESFYRSLFEIDPALRVLFDIELDGQQDKLVEMLEAIVSKMRAPGPLQVELRSLGERHVSYGVVDSDYHAVANALLAAIENQLGNGFTEALRLAWSDAFHLISVAMKEGAAQVEVAPLEGTQITLRQRLLVQGSWRYLQPIRARLARMFYGALFALEPSMRTLFADDMTGQRSRFLVAIDMAVNGLSNLASLRPSAEELGRRHVGYGVREQDYEVVAQALLVALQRCLSETFTAELRSAWVETYGMLAQMMLDGGTGQTSRRARRRPKPPELEPDPDTGGTPTVAASSGSSGN